MNSVDTVKNTLQNTIRLRDQYEDDLLVANNSQWIKILTKKIEQCDLSIKVCRELIPLINDGMTYAEVEEIKTLIRRERYCNEAKIDI